MDESWRGHDDPAPLVRQSYVDCMNDCVQLTSLSIAEFLPPQRIIRVLNRFRVPMVLVGQYGLAGWLQEARQCQQVELIIRPRAACTAKRCLSAAFATLECQKRQSQIQFIHRKSARIQVTICPAEEPMERAVFAHSTLMRLTATVTCRIPTLEAALAIRFASMMRLPWSDANKYEHAADFIRMVKVNANFDPMILAQLGDLVYPGGGKEIVEKVRQVRAGKRLQL